jgi:hypothetical protein
MIVVLVSHSSIREYMSSILKPAQLSGLRQAAYVMDCIVRNDNKVKIVQTLDDDQQLYDMWKMFLQHNNWITKTKQGWAMTPKGAGWSKRSANVNSFY